MKESDNYDLEIAVHRWAGKSGRRDLAKRVQEEAIRLMGRKRHPAPDITTAVSWAGVRVVDAAGCYEHDTGAVRGRY